MRLQGTSCIVVLVLALPLAGCQKDNALTAARDQSYHDPIQRIVEGKIADQSSPQTGAQRWEGHRADDYQTPDDIDQDRARLQLEVKRRQGAQRLLEAGALSLTDCLAFSLEFNNAIQASRAGVRAMGGQKLIARSRFLPRLTFDLSRASLARNLSTNVAMGIRGLQTLLEFGKDSPIDVSLRQAQRDALFAYEQDVAGALSEVRLRFFTILLKQQQLAQRRKLRDEFQARYERMQKLAKARRVLEVDVLTAKLNVLNEETRINALEKEVERRKMDLLNAMGFPLKAGGFKLAGDVEDYDLPLEKSVQLAYRRSTRIAQARAVVFEQDRVVRQLVWEYLPQIKARVGYRGRVAAGGAALDTENNVYGVGPYGESFVKPWHKSTFATDADWLDRFDSDWVWGVELELPLFTGLERTGRFCREKARLDRSRHLLCATVASTELAVRKAYQTVLEQERAAEILRETVQISKERLRVQERLKELGKIGDNELETFRERFFADQDRYFEKQIDLIQAQEGLRAGMRYFEPVPREGQ